MPIAFALQMVDFVGLTAKEQRGVGASGTSLLAGGAVGQRRERTHGAPEREAGSPLAQQSPRQSTASTGRTAQISNWQCPGRPYRSYPESCITTRRASRSHDRSGTDERISGKGGMESADTGADQREGLCAQAHKLLALTATS